MKAEVDAPVFCAEARDMNGLHRALRTRADQLQLSRTTLDDLTGLPDGYSSKVLAPDPIRRLGHISLGAYLQALGLRIIVVDDPGATARVLANTSRRMESQVRKRD